jgi:hypothetical protein
MTMKAFSFVVVTTLGVATLAPPTAAAAAFLQDMFPLPHVATSQPHVRPDLKRLTDSQPDTQLEIKFTVTNPEEEDDQASWASSQLSITGLILELSPENCIVRPSSASASSSRPNWWTLSSNKKPSMLSLSDNNNESSLQLAKDFGIGGPMPGANGPYPHLSSGPRRLQVRQSGQYINLLGTQTVQTLNGCWEMCWIQDKPHGTLICGLDIPQDYHRNAAYLPQGRVYFSFPVWSPQGLVVGQAQRTWAEAECAKMLQRRDDALAQFELTNNPFKKAFHLYQAFQAIEHYNDMPHATIERIPKKNQQSVLTLLNQEGNLLLSKEGVVYCKSGALQTKLGIPKEDFVYLGKAKVTKMSPASTSSSSSSSFNIDNNTKKTLRP